MKFPVAVPVAAVLSSANLALGYSAPEALRQAQGLARLIGPVQIAKPDSLAAGDMIALGAAMGFTHQHSRMAVEEAFLDSALYLLAEWEAMLGLPVSPSVPTATRRQRLIAKWRVLRGGSPKAITTALRALFVSPPSITLAENPASAGPYPSPTAVFKFAVVIPSPPPTFTYITDPVFLASVRATIDPMKPAHTSYQITNRVGFLCDSASSVCDLTLLGV